MASIVMTFVRRSMVFAGVCFTMALVLGGPCLPQNISNKNGSSQKAESGPWDFSQGDVAQSNVGLYRALAEVTFQAFDRRDFSTARKVARSLEMCWDGIEGNGVLRKKEPAVYQDLDRAMDHFIGPVLRTAEGDVDSQQVHKAYREYLEKLSCIEVAFPWATDEEYIKKVEALVKRGC